MDRRPWTPQEDQALLQVCEHLRANKWCLIARILEEKYGFGGRTGKQCRQRYNNSLNPAVCKDTWETHQENELCRLHDQLGNRWAVIAAHLGGRSDNGVKNHFFAKLRKAMRRINKILQERFKRAYREVRLNVLYKIVEANEERFKKHPNCSVVVSKNACALKNGILNLANDDFPYPGDEAFTGLLEGIAAFARDYKRRPKGLRRVVSEGAPIDISHVQVQRSPSFIEKESEESSEGVMAVEEQGWAKPDLATPSSLMMPSGSNIFTELAHRPEVEGGLEAEGVLEEEQYQLPELPVLLRKQTSDCFLMPPRIEEESEDNKFIDYSINQLPLEDHDYYCGFNL